MTYASQDITIRLCILFFSNVYKNKIDIFVTIVCIEWLLVDNPMLQFCLENGFKLTLDTNEQIRVNLILY